MTTVPPVRLEAEQVRRSIVILVDDLHITFANMYYVRRALTKFIDVAIQPGDLVKLDLTAVKDGYHTDSAVTIQVPPAQEKSRELAHCAERAFRQALTAARPGNRTKDIGRAVEREVRRRGFHVVRELGGHGVGRTIHESPSVPNYADPTARHLLAEGLVITIEPIIAAGTGRVSLDRDGWTVRTADGSLSAHYEHTIVITKGDPILLTAIAA
jgi:methionyl aminopeptidase